MDIAKSLRRAAFRVRYGLAQQTLKGAANGLPIPPPELNHLVSGTEDVEWYVFGGKLGHRSIECALLRNCLSLNQFKCILDFGCGSGRVIRYWKGQPAEVHGSDINPKLIGWCQKYLKFASFQVNPLAPPLDYPDGKFDLIYALSVFTHLNEKLQFAWMDEMKRVLMPGGYLVITTHGPCPYYLKQLSEANRAAFLRGEFVSVNHDEEGGNSCGAFHPEAWVRERLAGGLEVVDFLRGGAMGNPFQDLWVLRKPLA